VAEEMRDLWRKLQVEGCSGRGGYAMFEYRFEWVWQEWWLLRKSGVDICGQTGRNRSQLL